MKKFHFRLSLLVFIISMFFALSNTNAQLPYTYWGKAYNGPTNLQDSSVAICTNSAGMVFVTGWTLVAAGNYDIVTIRYNPDTGDTIWVKKFGASLDDRPTSMVADAGSVYVTGWTFNPGRDIVTIKYNAATGDTTWVKRYNGSNNGGDYGFCIAVDAAGNVYSAGRSDVIGGVGQKITVLKYDAAGNVPSGWPVVYTGASSTVFDEAHSIKVDGAGNVYVCGRSGATGLEDFITMKINAAGAIQWVKKYNGTMNQEDNAVALVLDNTAANVYVGGYGFIPSSLQDFIILKYSSNGDSLGFVNYHGSGAQIDIMTAMTIDASNNVYCTGYSTGSGTGYDYATLKYNSSLAQQWVGRTTDGGSDYPFSICVGDTNSVYVTGSSFGASGYDYLTIKYRQDGTESWRKRENGSANSNDFASSVAYISYDKVFVTGSANNSPPGSIEFYTLRYSSLVGIEPISTLVPDNFKLSQNYPNPFNPSTTINFDIPKSQQVKIAVYDIIGREVEVLADQVVKAGQYKVVWNALGFASGTYFYRLTSENYSETKRMILVK